MPRAEDGSAEIRSIVLDGVGAVWTERGRKKEQRDKPEMRAQKESQEVELKDRERDLAIQRQG